MKTTNEINELEEMRQQMNILRKKLENQSLINEQMIRQTMRTRFSVISRMQYYVLIGIAYIIVRYFWISTTPLFSTAYMVSLWCYMVFGFIWKVFVKLKLQPKDFTSGNLIEVSHKLFEMRKLYRQRKFINYPVIVVFIIWTNIEIWQYWGILLLNIGLTCLSIVLVLVSELFWWHKYYTPIKEIETQLQEFTEEI